MNHKTLIIVGDDYAHFAEHDGVQSVSQLWHALSLSGETGLQQVYFGQGIDEQERQRLGAMLQERGVRCLEGLQPLVRTELTHKRDRAHVLIAGARQISDFHYLYDLFIDDGEDRLCDHVTGQHLAAMPLVEAARQGVIVSLERQYPTAPDRRWGLVLENITADFGNYAFPVPTSLSITIRENSVPTSRQIEVSLFIVFHQARQQICDMRFDVKLYEAGALAKIEERKARKIVATLQGELHDAPV